MIQTLSNIDNDMYQGLGRILRQAFRDGLIAAPVRDESEQYHYGYTFNGDSFFTGATYIQAATFTFAENTPASDTITDSGEGFLDAGFVAGQSIVVSGSGSNDGSYTIAEVTAGVITLESTDDLAAEAAGETVTIYTPKKSYLLRIDATAAAGTGFYGDSHGGLFKADYTNRATNDANFQMRGLNFALSNRGGGILNNLEGFQFSVRQRGDGGAITKLRAGYLAILMDVGGTAPSSEVKGLHVDMKCEEDCPTNSAGVCVRNYTDGVYTLPTAAFSVKNDGTSGCKGFEYILDAYDSNAATYNTAPIRFGKTGSEDIVIATGDFTDGADSGFAPGSIGLDTANGHLFVSDSSGLWQVVTV